MNPDQNLTAQIDLKKMAVEGNLLPESKKPFPGCLGMVFGDTYAPMMLLKGNMCFGCLLGCWTTQVSRDVVLIHTCLLKGFDDFTGVVAVTSPHGRSALVVHTRSFLS
jgi:hypothetical protein